MKHILHFLFLIFVPAISTTIFGQEEIATAFFFRVPEMLKTYPPPGNPCNNAVEFTVNKNEYSAPLQLIGGKIAKGKGKTKLNVSESGNKTVWYKISFSSDCDFGFRIYSDKAKDTYHFFVYKDDGNKNFCQKLSGNNVVPVRASMLAHKEGTIGTGISEGMKINYKDTSENYFNRVILHTPFLSGIKAKSGETYYISVYHTEGTDPYHYLVLSACYKEVNLLTQNDTVSDEQAKIIEKLPEHITNPPKTPSEKDSIAAVEKKTDIKKKPGENEKAEKNKTTAATQKSAGEATIKSIAKKNGLKKLNAQVVKFDEPDTLNQLIFEGEVVYAADPRGPLVEIEIYLVNKDGTVTIFKKIYTNEKGAFRFANLPADQNYFLLLNTNDPKLIAGTEIILNGKIYSAGKPTEGIAINKVIKSAADGSFTLSKNELFMLNVNDLFNRWSIDLTNSAQYAGVLKKYGNVSVDGLFYKVQVGAYREDEKFDYSFLNELGAVEKQKESDGITRFVMGNFKTLKEADAFKQKVIAKNINDAFILAYFNGTRTYLEELIEKKMLGEGN